MDREAERTRQAQDATGDAAAPGRVGEEAGRPLENVLEALLLTSDTPLSMEQLQRLLQEEPSVDRRTLRQALHRLDARCAGTACELREVAGGWRLQVRSEYSDWIARLQKERPSRISRAMLEVLAIIVYRQPVTRGEIEEIRGVTVSTNVLHSLVERGWVRELGHKETLGRPILYGSTPQFLDDLNLHSLSQLPELPEIQDVGRLDAALHRMGLEGLSRSQHEAGVSGEDLPKWREQEQADRAGRTGS